MLLSNELSIERKVKEILLATRIEEALPKDRILELYLNEIYLGSGAYGVVAAALTYFNKSLDELTLGEAAYLAGLPKAPNNYNPVRFAAGGEGAARLGARPHGRGRQRDRGRGRRGQGRAARTAPPRGGRDRHRRLFRRGGAARAARPLRREGRSIEGGLSVRTSLDARLQAAADKALRDGLIAYDRSHGGWRGAVGHIDPGPNWPARLAAEAAAGRRRDGRMAARGGAAHRDRRRGDRPQGRRDRPHPVCRRCAGRGRCATTARSAPSPRSAADVVKPGDLVLVEPLPEEAGRPRRPKAPRRKAATRQTGHASRRRSITSARSRRSRGALVAIDPHTGRVLAMSGGFSFEIEPVQPRHPGEAAAGLVDQAVRLPDRAGKRFHPVDPGRRRADLDQPGSGHAGLDAVELQQQQVPRADAAARRARTVAEHGDGAAGRDDRHGADRPRQSRNSASWTTCRGSTRWRSAPARRRRCATPRPMRCSTTAARRSPRR